MLPYLISESVKLVHLLTIILEKFERFYLYTTVQEVLGRFEVSKDIYVRRFKQHAFDPLLSNKTTDYYHKVLYLKNYKAKVKMLYKLISIFYNV